jgi:hypothetical protein
MKDLSIFKGVSVNPRNAELFEFLVNYARSKGVPVFEGTSKDSYNNGYIYLWFSGVKFVGATPGYAIPNPISVEEFMALCDEWANDDVKLNNDYTAKIDRKNKVVNVGCQKFSFESINNLHKAINQ